MAMFCKYCGERMTSAPSHMDHERECAKNPAVEVVMLRAVAQAAVAFANKAGDYERPTTKGLRFEFLDLCAALKAAGL